MPHLGRLSTALAGSLLLVGLVLNAFVFNGQAFRVSVKGSAGEQALEVQRVEAELLDTERDENIQGKAGFVEARRVEDARDQAAQAVAPGIGPSRAYLAAEKLVKDGVDYGGGPANIIKGLKQLCVLAQKDELNVFEQESLVNLLTRMYQEQSLSLKAAAQVPGFVTVLLDLAKQGSKSGTRRNARELLSYYGAASKEVTTFLADWEAAEKRATQLFEDAVAGKLLNNPEAQALAGRFVNTSIRVLATGTPRQDVDLVILRQRPMTDLQCAQACAYGTEAAFQRTTVQVEGSQASKNPLQILRGCASYALLGGSACLMTDTVFGADTLSFSVASQAGEGFVRTIRVPAAVQFCMKVATLPRGERSDALLNCSRNLTEQYSSTVATTVANLKNPAMVKHVCESECSLLSDTIKHYLSFYIGASRDPLALQCTNDVVQAVEAHEMQCCAAACGWDPRSRSCTGLGLLTKVKQEEWLAECCASSTVMFGSDRDYMCRSGLREVWNASRSKQEEIPQRGAQEAFQVGDDVSLDLGAAKAALLELDSLAATSSSSSSSSSSSAASSSSSSAASASAFPSPCALECASPDFFESILLQCSAASRREWLAVRNGVATCPEAGVLQRTTTKSPADCEQLAVSKRAEFASWRFLPGQSTAESPRLGACTLHGNCSRQAARMLSDPKAAMSNTTELLWRKIVL